MIGHSLWYVILITSHKKLLSQMVWKDLPQYHVLRNVLRSSTEKGQHNHLL